MSRSPTTAPSAAPASVPGAGDAPPRNAAGKRKVAGIFTLRPMQKAMLLHCGIDGVVDPGFMPVHFTLSGALDPERWRRAWQEVLARHESLRMALRALAGKDPRILVWREASLPMVWLDWSGESASGRHRLMDELLADERGRGLDLYAPPVMRLTTIRLGDDRHEVVWSCHHLFLDGWSVAMVVKQVLEQYGAGLVPARRSARPPALSYAGYLEWLRRRPQHRVEAFWRQRLAGFAGLPALRLSDGSAEFNTSAEVVTAAVEPVSASGEALSAVLDVELCERLRQICSTHRVTLTSLFQAAWALLLRRLVGQDDLVFGMTVSGRGGGLDGVDELVGLLSNVVPIRIAVDAGQALVELLQRLRDLQFQVQAYEHTTLDEIRRYSEVAGGRPLFETLLVVENFPWRHDPVDGDALRMTGYNGGISSTLPLAMACNLDETWELHCSHDPARFSSAAVAALLCDYRALLEAIATGPERPVAQLCAAVAWSSDAGPLPEAGAEVGSELGAASHVAPRNQTELELARIWEDLLRVQSIGVGDDFFAIGGTSFAAVQLFARIAARFDRELPLATLLQHPTIEALAAQLDRDAPPDWRCLVPIQLGGSRTPLICVHAGGGHVLFYRELARHLGPDQPVFGLQPIGLDDDEPPLRDLTAMARHYVAELLTVQPEGPYLLAGYCVGATVSLAMARVLEAQGKRVALILALDSGPPPLARLGAIETGIAKANGLRFNWGRGIRRKLYRELIRPLVIRYARPERRRKALLDRVEQACWDAFWSYQPSPCDAPIALIWSSNFAPLEEKQFYLDWGKLTSTLWMEKATVKHETMMLEPEVAETAALVSGYIDRVMSTEAGPVAARPSE